MHAFRSWVGDLWGSSAIRTEVGWKLDRSRRNGMGIGGAQIGRGHSSQWHQVRFLGRNRRPSRWRLRALGWRLGVNRRRADFPRGSELPHCADPMLPGSPFCVSRLGMIGGVDAPPQVFS